MRPIKCSMQRCIRYGAICAAIALSACARDRSTVRDDRRIAVQDDDRGTFDAAYDSVRSGARATAQAGEYVVERTEDAAVRVWRGTKEAARATRRGLSDGWITTKVKGTYATNGEVRARSVDVDTRDGVVTLTGNVGSQAEATQAVRLALDTDGVIEVRSRLNYPVIEQRYQRGF